MTANNSDVKSYAKAKGVYLWQVADKLGILDSNFSRNMRRELPETEKTHIFAIIDELAAAKQKEA